VSFKAALSNEPGFAAMRLGDNKNCVPKTRERTRFNLETFDKKV
jgi:hypothetical protein